MKLFNLFKKLKQTPRSNEISDFLLHAPEAEQKEIFMEAARMANEEQREVFRKAQLKTKGA